MNGIDIPVRQDEKDSAAHIVCADGEILRIPQSGYAECTALNELDGYALSVYA